MSMEEVEKKILDELAEEIRELKRQGKLHKFESAMDNAMEKFKIALKDHTENTLEEVEELKKNVQNADEKQE